MTAANAAKNLPLSDGFFSAHLSETDPELADAIRGELRRQQDQIELIASENNASAEVIAALKIAGVVERIGDYSKNIAKASKEIGGNRKQFEPLTLLPAMAEVAAEMVHDVLTAYAARDAELARERGEPVDLQAMLADIADLYEAVRKDGDAKIVFHSAEEESVFVTALEGLLGQVFRNLLDNARTFSPPGGEVTLTLDAHAAMNGGPAAKVTVEDQGPGIPPENLETVFERFYTERPPGAVFGAHSGLGLSIARQIVESHGGIIAAENMDDGEGGVRGARFTVLLPLHTAL